MPIFVAKMIFSQNIELCQFLDFTIVYHHAKKTKKKTNKQKNKKRQEKLLSGYRRKERLTKLGHTKKAIELMQSLIYSLKNP